MIAYFNLSIYLLKHKIIIICSNWCTCKNHVKIQSPCGHNQLRGIKWKYHVLLTRIQIENHFNLLNSVCINAWENTAYVTNPLSDCDKKSEYVSAFVFDFFLIHIKRISSSHNKSAVLKRKHKKIKNIFKTK